MSASRVPEGKTRKSRSIAREAAELKERLRLSLHRFAESAAEPAGLSLAAEWLLDNAYIVDRALRQVSEDLPPRFVRQLPRAAGPDGPLRVVGLARAMLDEADGQVDLDALRSLARGFRGEPPLTIGEVWALPAVLRLEILRGLALVAQQAAESPSRRERDELGARLGRGITGLRTIANTDWKEVFEQVSPVEAALRTDPAGVYARMDFGTRDRYRKAVEELARGSDRDEVAVAREAVRRAASAPEGSRVRHVGFHLVDAGRPALEEGLEFRPRPAARYRRGLKRFARPVYGGAVALGTAAALAAFLAVAAAMGAGPAGLALLAVLALVPAVTLAVSVVQFLVSLALPPRVLPKMDYAEGIPEESRTLVAVPALLSGVDDLGGLLRSLEMNWLGNPRGAVAFALLTDFTDAPQREMPDDARLLAAAVRGIEELNERYRDSHRDGDRDDRGRPPFLLLHRERAWNPVEKLWMGWERKRGKLTELNSLLAGEPAAGLRIRAGDPERLRGVSFVVTLDADTHMPSGAAARMAAALAHPLNRPEIDLETGRVVAGYTVIQPRVEVQPESANRTLFSRLFAGDGGLDPYTLAVSDAYQDLFGEGIFAGKGIYDAAAFHRCLAGRVPDNRLLSHDLFEGLHGRAALASDVVLLEDFPANWLVFSSRLHRWVRGDWQILSWLLPRVPAPDGGRQPNRIRLLGRWMILDNLRRSLLAPSLLLLLLAGWLLLPGPAFWSAAAVVVLSVPVILGGTSLSLRLAGGAAWRPTLADAARSLKASSGRALAALVFLPHEAVVSADAVVRTLARLAVTRRGLLEWTTVAHSGRRFGKPGSGVAWRRMAAAPISAVAAGILVAALRPEALPAALPLLLLWLLAPEVAWRTARPAVPREPALRPEEALRLRRLARRTWRFYERFVGPGDHFLPPDNYQEDPGSVVAHRTSPTNVGLYLLSTAAAWDLGYLGTDSLAAQLGNTLETFDRFPDRLRFRGHLVNWIDTRSLEPLEPRYVSTVDSGNFAACLLAVARSCADAADAPFLRPALRDGLADTAALLSEVLQAIRAAGRPKAARAAEAALGKLAERIETAGEDPAEWVERLAELRDRWLMDLQEGIAELLDFGGPGPDPVLLAELAEWTDRLRHGVSSLDRTVTTYLPWLPLLVEKPRFLTAAEAPPGVRLAWADLATALRENPSPRQVESFTSGAAVRLRGLQSSLAEAPPEAAAEIRAWADRLGGALQAGRTSARALVKDLDGLAQRAEREVAGMDFRFLFDPRRRLFRIGYDVSAGEPDPNEYDLLASESRLASFLAIALGEVPESHWVHLGRPFARVDGALCLLSWGGSMFEYLMPMLLLESPRQTSLDESCRSAVRRQIAFGREHGIPWGISESGYHEMDAHRIYRYRAFGVPGLGLKRDLGERLVVAPYASLLAVGTAPQAVLGNLTRLIDLHAQGRYGLFEAIDFGAPGPGAAGRPQIVHSYMAHHQGMILAALANALCDDVLVHRFHRDPRVSAMEYLLYEQPPHYAPVEARWQTAARTGPQRPEPVDVGPWPAELGDVPIQSHVLSNGRLSSLVTSGGGGGLRWRGRALTRWEADPTLEPWGIWVYLQDLDSGELWSAAPQPAGVSLDRHEVRFAPHLVELRVRRAGIAARLEVIVSPGDNVEIRRLRLVNESGRPRRLAVTSYGEPALAPAVDDRRHPAFNKLFVESERIGEANGLLFRRRPRADTERALFLAHAAFPLPADAAVPDTWETDRARFLGRAGSRAAPAALTGGSGLSGTTGTTLDPIFALRRELALEPDQEVEASFLTAVGRSRREVLAILGRQRGRLPAVFDAARRHAGPELAEAGLDAIGARLAQRLFSAVVEPRVRLRGDRAALAANRLGQPGLWKHGISGDRPILLVHVRSGTAETVAFVREILSIHRYWRRRRIEVDAVLLDDVSGGYEQPVRDWLDREIVRGGGDEWRSKPGGVFVVRRIGLPPEDATLLEAAAAAVLEASGGDLARQLGEVAEESFRLPSFVPVPSAPLPADPLPTPLLERPLDLLQDNGFGGFTPDGREYVVHFDRDAPPPAPWINVIANPGFGFLASESGGGYTWAANSAEDRLTPWRNDPVLDLPGEALYLRDEETADVWTPTRLPAGGEGAFEARHRAGATVFRHNGRGLLQELEVFAAPDEPVKLAVLRLTDAWNRQRRITATYYAEWVLGTSRHSTVPHVVTDYDPATGALLASSGYPSGSPERTAFLASDREPHGFTCDRTEFLGWNGDWRRPAALDRIGLSEAVGPGLDPCAALMIHLDVPPGGTVEAWFLLGQGEDRAAALELVARYQGRAAAEGARRGAEELWDQLLGTVQVRTPEPEIDLLANRWLLYQALSCRIWGRSALYQSSGAFGFRDQLQDSLALLHAAPEGTRAQILNAARHQFEAGDVLHWWHPPRDRGMRTRCSDDLLWLPWAVAEYLRATGDASILDQEVPYLGGPELGPQEDERYDEYPPSGGSGSLYDHCLRALERGSTAGVHGLPLMGTGDWNDGMNRVGEKGRGESVWLAWFLYDALLRFAPVCESRGDGSAAARLRGRAERLRRATEESAWDGDWYLRAWYDDGAPLGSKESDECRIDLLVQAWSVLSGAADPERAGRALESAWARLVGPREHLARLLAPPFDKTPHDPGYIKGYPPGIRENGGQYSHAAVWAAWAFTRRGDGDRAVEILRAIDPLYRTRTPEGVALYQVEPYVVPADVYGVPPHTGRGGWTWYTGTAGWTWRLIVEAILGVRRRATSRGEAALEIDPCLPRDWPEATVEVRFGAALYRIRIDNPERVGHGVAGIELDGRSLGEPRVPLVDDGRVHEVRVRLGATPVPGDEKDGSELAIDGGYTAR